MDTVKTDTEWLIELAAFFEADSQTAQRLTAIAVKVNSYDNLTLTISEDGNQFAYHGKVVTA